MRTLDEVIDRLEQEYDTEEIVDMLQISSRALLERFDDYIVVQLERLNEELFEDEQG